MGEERVVFGGKSIALWGVVGGVIIATCGSWVILAYGVALGKVVMTLALMTALIMGGALAVTAAFFGIVIPSQVGGPQEPGERRGKSRKERS